MDSINRQQPEDHHQDLQGREAGKKIKDLIEKAKTCFFCTGIKTGSAFNPRPMTVQKVDENGTCWLLSATDSHKNKEIEEDPMVQLLFQGSTYSEFVTLYGQAYITTDKALIDELWEPIFKTWFTEGKDDPRISVIRFEPDEGYYWDTKHNQLLGFAKRLAGAIMGKTLDDSIEGQLST